MDFPSSGYAVEQPVDYSGRDYYRHLDEFVVEVIQRVDLEMRRQPAPMVYELISLHLAARLPGIEVDEDAIRDAAARIALGLPPL